MKLKLRAGSIPALGTLIEKYKDQKKQELGSKTIQHPGDRLVEGVVKAVERSKPLGFVLEKITRGFEEVGDKS